MKPTTTRKCAIEFLVIGVGLFLLSLIMILIFPGIYRSQLKKQTSLVQGSLLYPMWQDIPLPIYERIYFFNITNAEEFLREGAKLKVQQVGPYTYKSRWVKNPVAWNPNGTVSYREIRTYHFVGDESSRSEDDMVTQFNGPMLTAANMLKDIAWPLKLGASFLLGIENEKVIIQRSIRELVYGGYEDPVSKYAAYIIPNLPYKDGIFGWLCGKNATDDGMFTVFTGQKDINSLNVISKWNGAEKLGFWKGDTCDTINGTSGEVGPPLEEDQPSYTFFQSIFCRSLTFDYTGETNHFGVTSRRFKATDKVFANRTDNPDNFCFQTSEFLPSGVQDVSVCQFGSPMFISFPHFYLADPVYLDPIDGLNPQEDKHLSYFDVEPTTGLSVDLKIRFQVNVKLQKIFALLQFQHIPEGLFPVFWIELDASLTEDLAKVLLNALKRPKIIFYSLVGIVMVLSVFMIVGAIVVLIRLPKKAKDDDDPLLNPEDDKVAAKKDRSRQEKRDPIGDEVNRNLGFGDSSVGSGSNDEGTVGLGRYESDVTLIDASDVPEQSNNHFQGLRGGKP